MICWHHNLQWHLIFFKPRKLSTRVLPHGYNTAAKFKDSMTIGSSVMAHFMSDLLGLVTLVTFDLWHYQWHRESQGATELTGVCCAKIIIPLDLRCGAMHGSRLHRLENAAARLVLGLDSRRRSLSPSTTLASCQRPNNSNPPMLMYQILHKRCLSYLVIIIIIIIIRWHAQRWA